jgi:hypothetical protein
MPRESEHRRRSSRYPLRWKAAVVFDTAHSKPVVHTQTQDLSVIGAAIYTEHGDLTGAVVTLLLAYPSRIAGEIPKVLKVRARVVSSVRTPGMPQYRHGLSFIRSPDDGMDDLEEILRAVAPVAHRKEPDAVDTATAPDAGGRLAQLRQLARAKLVEDKTADPQDAINASVSDALGIAYRYLKDLAEQLNVINPAYRKGYSIAGVPEFNDLSWEEGHADFEMREVSPILRLYDRVSLRFQLSGKKQIRVARDYPASEKLKQWLADCNIGFNEHVEWNARGSIERTTFNFPCEVKASVLLFGQFDMGKLLLRTRNVSGFGAMEQILAPEAVSDESLDELTSFILGENSRLGPLLLQNA